MNFFLSHTLSLSLSVRPVYVFPLNCLSFSGCLFMLAMATTVTNNCVSAIGRPFFFHALTSWKTQKKAHLYCCCCCRLDTSCLLFAYIFVLVYMWHSGRLFDPYYCFLFYFSCIIILCVCHFCSSFNYMESILPKNKHQNTESNILEPPKVNRAIHNLHTHAHTIFHTFNRTNKNVTGENGLGCELHYVITFGYILLFGFKGPPRLTLCTLNERLLLWMYIKCITNMEHTFLWWLELCSPK